MKKLIAGSSFNRSRTARSATAIAALAAIICLFSAPARAATTLCAIKLPASPNETESYAAKELAAYARKITGTEIPVFEGAAKNSVDCGIAFIGKLPETEKYIVRNNLLKIEDEGFVIRSIPEGIVIAGAEPVGTLNGVYSFLEDVLGVRWYAPGAELVPVLDEISLEGIDASESPAFEYRESFFKEVFDADWGARNRMNGGSYRFRPEQGGSKIKYQGGFVHTFNSLVPPDEYFDGHPEYFAEINGVREKNSQLCLANQDVLGIVKKKVLEHAEAAEGKKVIISVSQNDNFKQCGCPKCAAVNREEGSPAGSMLRFVNSVADAVADEYPNVAIDTLAYQYSEDAPKITKPRPNVIVRLCHIAPSCDLHPLGKCFWNDKFFANLKEWSKLTDRLYIWDYHTDFWNYLQPFPILNMIKKDIKTFHDNSVKGYFAQGSYQSPGGDLAELKAWVIAKLLWNPDRDAGALIDDFVNGFYGPAAPGVMEYLKVQHRHAAGRNVHGHLYSEASAYLNADVLSEMNAALKKAEAAAPAGGDYADRVRKLRMNYMFTQLSDPELFHDGEGPANREQFDALFKTFEGELSHFGVTRIHEMEPIEKTLEKMKARLMNVKEND